MMDVYQDNSFIEETQPSVLLEAEIERARDQIKTLTQQRNALASALLSADRFLRSLDAQHDNSSSKNTAEKPERRQQRHGDFDSLANLIKAHKARSKVATQRAVLSTTTFLVNDPDPAAAAAGGAGGQKTHSNILLRGIRIERYSRITKTFHAPAYIFLQGIVAKDSEAAGSGSPRRGDDGEEGELTRLLVLGEGEGRTVQHCWWRVHRHTLPPCIPIQALAARYLPLPAGVNPNAVVPEGDSDSELDYAKPAKKTRQQDLNKFVRALRREIVGLFRRTEAIEQLSSAVEQGSTLAARLPGKIITAEAVNAEATDLRLAFASGNVARIRVGHRGDIRKVVARGPDSFERASLERRLLAKGRIENLLVQD